MRSCRKLFLTSKVRLHCDAKRLAETLRARTTFPDLKGQAPLRQVDFAVVRCKSLLFLTSKVRLHCDVEWMMALPAGWVLFLTSKVRLHCDPVRPRYCHVSPGCGAFPDLKGQAPLRRELGEVARVFVLGLFLTSKVRLHCDCGVVAPSWPRPCFS